MKKHNQVAFMAVALYCLGYTSSGIAGHKLDKINAQVEQQSIDIDQKHGVLLDTFERLDLKLDLIAKQALIDTADTATVKQIAELAFTEYQITDPSEQRKLLIKIEAQKSTGGGGTEPDYP